MQYIGNVISTVKKNIYGDGMKLCHDEDECIKNIPTIIIGLDEAKKKIDGFNLRTRSYHDGMLWWTFRKTESRDDNDRDLDEFRRYCFERVTKTVKYTYLDIPSYHYSTLKRTINFIRSKTPKTCFLTRESNFVFIYSTEYNTVFGLSLTLLEYAGVDKEKVKRFIRSNTYNRFIYDTAWITPEVRKTIGEDTHLILPLYNIFTKK